MVKPHLRLRLVKPRERPLAPLSRAEKLAQAIGWLRQRGRYVLDTGTPKPKWGVPGDPPKVRTTIRKEKP